MTDEPRYEYDFCLSFAAEERPYVEDVARHLLTAGLRVFYDSEETADLLGADLYTRLDDVYNRQSRFCVLFASAAFARRMWTRHERRSAQDRAFRSQGDYILPIRFDDTPIPGLRATTGHVDARITSPASLATILLAKHGSGSGPAPVDSSIVVLTGGSPDSLRGILEHALTECRVNLTSEQLFTAPSRVIGVIPETALRTAEVVTTLANAAERASRESRVGPLRIAVHCGQVPPVDYPAAFDVNTAVEAALSAAVTDFVARIPDARCCAVIATERVYDAVIRPGRGGSNPSLYRLVTTATGTALHVRVFGYPRPPDRQATPTPTPTGPSITHGDTHNLFYRSPIGQVGDRYYGGAGHDD
ncbi:toll/interleukin-1 receptor domain-containing protein [Amycolatopsis sp. MEPSY49]|uniref:toll/interleukin-1 receptor domain-containing protein n=1 Tax=Amycolatopsis sp. MEPSY49 TaxID=3151600 RepID=UPI003EF4873A